MNILAHMYSGFVTVKKPWWKNEYKRFYVAYTLLQAVADQCTFKYSINCFLMDVYKLMDKSRATNKYQILPGIYVVKDDTSGGDAIDLVQRAVISNQTELLDVYVQKKLNAYLDALSLSVKIMDRNSAISVRKFSDNFITELLPTINTGRGKKKGSKDSAVWAAGAIAALGSSALFAMSGKAVVVSMVALLLSMMCYFKGHGGSSSYTTATTGAISSPYRTHQCAEAIIDVNAKDYNAALIGYKKRTLDDTWNYPRYATTPTSEPTYGSHNK